MTSFRVNINSREHSLSCFTTLYGIVGCFLMNYSPVLHLLVPEVGGWEVLVEAVVGGVAGRMVDDGGVSVK